jgi:hypothetical protein
MFQMVPPWKFSDFDINADFVPLCDCPGDPIQFTETVSNPPNFKID